MTKKEHTFRQIGQYKYDFNKLISESEYVGFVEPKAVTDIQYNAKLSYWGCQLPDELQAKVDNLIHLYEYAISNYDEEEEKVKPILTKEEWQKLDTDWGEYDEDEEGWVTVYDSSDDHKLRYSPIDLDTIFNNVLVESKVENDAVNHPSHYTFGKYETIEVIKDILTPEEYRGYCRGNALKYIARAGRKGDLKEDYEKARTYLNFLLGELK